MTTIRKLFIPLLLGLVLVGCAPLIKAEQPIQTGLVILESGQTLGQTFVARFDGLRGVALYLEPDMPGDGTLMVHLRADQQESANLRSSSLRLQDISTPGYYDCQFSPIEDSTGKYYYLVAKMRGGGTLKVGTAHGDTYLDGALYLNHVPQDAQTAFRLEYSRRLATIGLFREGLTWLTWLAAAFFLFIIPGWGLFCLLWPNWNCLHWAEKLGLAGGLSLALYPLLILWTDLVGLHLGLLYAWLPPLVGLAVILWRNHQRIFMLPSTIRSRRALTFSFDPIPWADMTLLIVIGLIFAVRFWVIRELDAPLWGDSYQHSVIAQLLIDNRGLFDSWQPYAEMVTFTYHFGFHSTVAVYHLITGLPSYQATLWVGQILNGMAAVFLFPLSMRIKRNPWAGVVTVLLVGLLVPMPMYYVNWGRYTQLAGQTILPAAIYLVWVALEANEVRWRSLALVWITWGGLALTHYRVLIIAVIFIGAFLVLFAHRIGIRRLLIRVFWLGLGAGLLFLPWFINVFSGRLAKLFYLKITKLPNQLSNFDQSYNAIGDLSSFLPMFIWLIAMLVIGWGLWRRDRGVALISLWWFLVLLIANPKWVSLPGTGAVNNFTIFIAAYIPASLLIGPAFGWLLESVELKPKLHSQRSTNVYSKVIFPVTLCLLMLGLGLLGAGQRRAQVPITPHALVTRPDMRAARWIQDNIPQEARFLVNSFTAFGDSLIAGSDAGWWLPLLAKRGTSLPPLAYGGEVGPWLGYYRWIKTLTKEVTEKGIAHPDVLKLLEEHELDFIYIGQRQGRVNLADPPLKVDELLNDPHFRPVYHQDRVWIFEIIHNP